MKTMQRSGFLLAALFVGACGRDVTSASQSTELRLRGTNSGAYSAVLVDVRDLTVFADGKSLTVKPGQTKMDLGNTDHAWLVGSVVVPEGTKSLSLSLLLDDFGGYETATAAGAIDARGAPIRLVAPVDLRSTQATVLVDVTRSLVAGRGDTRILVPDLTVAF